jgi:hypothetical protein
MTGCKLSAITWDQLMAKATAARRANGVPIGVDFENEVEQWAVLAHPDEVEVWDPDMPKKVRLGLDDIIHGMRVIVALKMAGSPLVSREEAERRAGICARCYMNQGFSRPCATCGGLEDLVRALVGAQGTSQDDKLHACGICHCLNKAQVWLPLDILAKGVTDQMKTQFSKMAELTGCWKQVDPSPANG